MSKFCENCGALLREGARFCTTCGLPVSQASQPNNPYTNNQNTPSQGAYPQQAPSTNFPGGPMPQPVAPKKKKKGKGGIVVLIVVLIVVAALGVGSYLQYLKEKREYEQGLTQTTPTIGETTISNLIQNWDEEDDELPEAPLKVIKTEEGVVTEENPAVTLCGVTIDVHPGMLSGGSMPVTVSLKESSVDDEGVHSDNYALEMNNHEEFEMPVKVTFPFSGSPDVDPVVSHFNDETGEWETQLGFADRENRTVTAYFGSFCDVKETNVPKAKESHIYVVRTPDKKMPYVKKIEVASNWFEIIQGMDSRVYKGEIEKFEACVKNKQQYAIAVPELNPNMSANEVFGSFQKASDSWTLIYDPLINMGLESLPPKSQNEVLQYVINNSWKMGKFMTTMPFVIMSAQLIHDVKNESRSTTAVNLYKNILTNSGTIYSLVSGFGHLGFSLAFTGVSLFGKELEWFIDAAKAEQKANVAAVFDSYYTNIRPINNDQWFDSFKTLYWRHDNDIEEVMREIGRKVDDYCNEFWQVYPSLSEDFWFSIGDAEYKKVFENATVADRRALTVQQKKKVWEQINSNELIHDYLNYQLYQSTYKRLCNNPLVAQYNKEHTFTIRERVAGGKEHAKYQGCIVCFGIDGQPLKGWNHQVSESRIVRDGKWVSFGWSTSFPCSVYQYIKWGMPNQVLVYKNMSDVTNGKKPIAIKDFKVDMNVDGGSTEINFGEDEPEEEEEVEENGNCDYKGDRIEGNVFENDANWLKSLERAVENTCLTMKADGSFSGSGKGAYSGTRDNIHITGVRTVWVEGNTTVSFRGNFDEAKGEGTFTMQSFTEQTSMTYTMDDGERKGVEVPANVGTSLDATGKINQKENWDHEIYLLFSGRGSMTLPNGNKMPAGDVEVHFLSTKEVVTNVPAEVLKAVKPFGGLETVIPDLGSIKNVKFCKIKRKPDNAINMLEVEIEYTVGGFTEYCNLIINFDSRKGVGKVPDQCVSTPESDQYWDTKYFYYYPED